MTISVCIHVYVYAGARGHNIDRPVKSMTLCTCVPGYNIDPLFLYSYYLYTHIYLLFIMHRSTVRIRKYSCAWMYILFPLDLTYHIYSFKLTNNGVWKSGVARVITFYISF